MKIVILDAATFGDDVDFGPLHALGQVVKYPLTAEAELAERIGDADMIVTNKVKLNRNNLGPARKLQMICEAATGYDGIDTAYCREQGIAVSNVPGYSTESVAQLTLAMALSLLGHLTEYREFVHSGDYTRSGIHNRLTPVWHEIAGKTWGVIGGGNIGQRVAELAAAFGCKVLICRRKRDERFENAQMDDLCARADIISAHLPLTEETRGMIGKDQIARMKPDAIFINVARGAVADEAALAEAILEERIGALGMDVYSVEPFGADHPYQQILDRPNVCMTPHTAWGSIEARNRCVSIIAENILAFQSGIRKNRVE